MRNQNIPAQANLDRIVTAVADINEHNQKFGSEAELGRTLAGVVASQLGREREYTSLQPTVGASIEDLIHTHKTALQQNGFGLIVNKNNSITIFLDNVEAASNFITVIPRNAFPAPLAQSLAKTVRPLFVHLAEMEPFEDISKASCDIGHLCELLASRGASQAIEPSYVLLRAMNGGFLNEQLKADHSKILQQNSFGPSEWHLDSLPANLYKKWQEAISTTAEIRANPRAIDLSERMINVLGVGLEAFEKSINQWSRGQIEFPYKTEKLSRYVGVARLARADFNDLIVLT